MWLMIDALLGVVLGLLFAWAYSARETHRRLKRLDPNARLPAALVVSRILSIGLTVVVGMASNVIVRAYEPSWLNMIAYAACTLSVAIGTWKFVLKPKTV